MAAILLFSGSILSVFIFRFFIITLYEEVRYKSLKYQNVALKFPPFRSILLTLRSHGTTVDSMKVKQKTYVFSLSAFTVVMAKTYFAVSVWNKPQLT